MGKRADTASKLIRVPASRIYRAFATPDAMAAWLPPEGMVGTMLAFDVREGGKYRMRLAFKEPEHTPGKTRLLVIAARAVDRVLGITDARNHASVRLLERVGMRRTKTRNALFRGEQFVEHVYALARGEGRPFSHEVAAQVPRLAE